MIDITVDMNVKELDADLVALLYRLGRKAVERFLNRAGVIAIASVRKTLAAGGRPTPWAPLSAATIERRSGAGARGKSKSNTPLGGKTGAFYKYIRKSLYNFGNAVRIFPPDRKVSGRKRSLAQIMKFHEVGAGSNPVRKAFFLQREDVETIMAALALTIDEAIHGKKSKMKSLSADMAAPVSRFGGQIRSYVGKRRKSIARTQRRARRAFKRAAKSFRKSKLVPSFRKALASRSAG